MKSKFSGFGVKSFSLFKDLIQNFSKNPAILPISAMYIDIIFVVGPLAFTIIGSIVAFLSGLIFTLNNFLVKATRADFGEVLAVRCLIQIPLMGTIAILNGTSKTFWTK